MACAISGFICALFVLHACGEEVCSLGEEDLYKDQLSDLCFNPLLFKMVPLGFLLSPPWLVWFHPGFIQLL